MECKGGIGRIRDWDENSHRDKTLASLIHQRLLRRGTEDSMHASQYGFRPGRGTADALMVARCMVEAAVRINKDGLLLVLLDRAKVCDHMKTDSKLSALRRFGLPSQNVCCQVGSPERREYCSQAFLTLFLVRLP